MENVEKSRVMESPVGPLTLTARSGRLTGIAFGKNAFVDAEREKDAILDLAEKELKAYFNGKLREFTVPVAFPPGIGVYTLRVLEALRGIPYGGRVTYGGLAAKLSSSARAVGGAVGRNPLPIMVPCHRVVAAHGLGGYSGDWESGRALSVKKTLLELEAR